MKKKYEKPELKVVVFGSCDTLFTTSSGVNGVYLYGFYGGIDGGVLTVQDDDK